MSSDSSPLGPTLSSWAPGELPGHRPEATGASAVRCPFGGKEGQMPATVLGWECCPGAAPSERSSGCGCRAPLGGMCF